jgi:phosphate-selective porin O/P
VRIATPVISRILGLAALLAPAAHAEEPETAPETETPAAAAEALPPPTIGGAVHVRYEKTDRSLAAQPSKLSLARARAELQWQPDKRVEGVLGVDVSGPADEAKPVPVVPLDAYMQVKAFDWLRVRAGHRKVPFSGLRLQSSSRLPTVARGEYSRQLDLEFDDNGSADLARDVGVDLRFRAKPERLRLDVGLSQGEQGPKDVEARVSARPAGGLEVAAAVAYIDVTVPTTVSPSGEQRRLLYEVDSQLDLAAWHAEIEGAAGDAAGLAADGKSGDHFGAAYALLSYRIALGKGKTPAIEPLLRGDIVNQTFRLPGDQAWAITGALNLYPVKYVRLMIDGEHVERYLRYSTRNGEDENRLLVQLAFDI